MRKFSTGEPCAGKSHARSEGGESREALLYPAYPPTDGETAVQIAARALPVITEIETRHKDGNVLLVSHKATIRIILCSLLGIDVGRYRDRINALAASVCVVKFSTYGPMLEVLGDRGYMPEHLRNRTGT